MNDERDELEAFLDAGRARYGGVALAAALDEATIWAETRATRRRRTARIWVACGVLAGVLAGGSAVAAAMIDDPEGDVIPTSTALTFVSDGGAVCVVEIRPTVHSSNPRAWTVVRSYLSDLDPPTIDLPALLSGGSAADREIATLVDGLSHDAEDQIFRTTHSRVQVTLVADYSCSAAPAAGDDYGVTPPVVGDDFGREPTANPGRAPDVVGFFRASTGQICEIQMKVDPDWAATATEADGARTARAFLATVDFAEVEYSEALDELAEFWPDDQDKGVIEALALAGTLTDQMRLLPSPTGVEPLPITVETWTHCDPEPSE